MTDTLSKEQRSVRMRSVKQRDTSLELLVRKGLHRRGLRYRLGNSNLPGSPDIVLPARRAIVFVHGCFWHAHDCRLGKRPRSNAGYWQTKASANRARDARKEAELSALGWRVFVVWQCELGSKARESRIDRLAEDLARGAS